jgi:hypothetical protein
MELRVKTYKYFKDLQDQFDQSNTNEN